MASNDSYDTVPTVVIILPTSRANIAPPAGPTVAGTFAATSIATMSGTNTSAGTIPVGVPIVVSSSPQGGTALEVGGIRRELRLAGLSIYALRHLEKAKAFQEPTIEVHDYKSKEKYTVRLFKVVKLELKSLKVDASRSIKKSVALVKAFIKGKGKVYSLSDIKVNNGDAFFDIEEKLTSLKHRHEHDETQPPLTEFPMFTTLPVELQDEVWKCYLVQNPQMLTLPPDAETRAGYPGNPSLILRQINQRLRAQPLAAYGYVTFSTRFGNDEVPRMGDPGFAINPTVDLLYVPDATIDSIAGGFRGRFGPTQAISQVRTIAVDLYIRPSNIFTHVWRTGMHEWVNLELVMIAVQEDTAITDRGSFYFKTMAVGEHLPRNQQHSFGITLKLLQLIFTRGSRDGDIVPRIVPVCKVYTG